MIGVLPWPGLLHLLEPNLLKIPKKQLFFMVIICTYGPSNI